MKIIDLLNKIANCEVVPKKINYRDYNWEFTSTVVGTGYQYYDYGYQEWKTLQNQVYLEEHLNDEVEIIEDKPKYIKYIKWEEKESLAGELTEKQKNEILARRTEKLKKILNEVIDKLNEMSDK